MAGAALVAPRVAWPADTQTPHMLDHILLGCRDSDRGIALFEERLGVRAGIGGVDSGRGTRNALLSLGEHRYLEIIAPDPEQNKIPDFAAPLVSLLKSLSTPRLVGWAAHPGNVEALAKRLRESGIAFDGPRAGSRQRTDGRLLKWKTINLPGTTMACCLFSSNGMCSRRIRLAMHCRLYVGTLCNCRS